MRKLGLLLLPIIICFSCMAGRIKIEKHPDINLLPISVDSVKIYDKFLPARKFYLIGKITISTNWFTAREKTRQNIKQECANIGGNAVIITTENISWYRYKTTDKYGYGNIYDYGYNYGLDYYEKRITREHNIPTGATYYGYVVKFYPEFWDVKKATVEYFIRGALLSKMQYKEYEKSKEHEDEFTSLLQLIGLLMINKNLSSKEAIEYFENQKYEKEITKKFIIALIPHVEKILKEFYKKEKGGWVQR